MRILLLNDTIMRGELELEHEVRACGPVDRYPMPDQDRFDFTFPAKTEQLFDDILARLGDFRPDLLIHTETTTNYFYRGIDRAPFPTVWRVIDSHIHLWQPRYAVTHDMVLVAVKDSLPSFTAVHPHAHWLPLHSFPRVHFDRGLPRDVPITFVGSLDPVMHPQRTAFIEALSAQVPVTARSGLEQEELSILYNRTKIVVNQCVRGDLNYRVFEAMANGALLVTPRIGNGLLELFGDGRELVNYREHDASDAARICQYYLEHEDEREAIAEAGRKAVARAHTLSHRVRTVLELVEKELPRAFAERANRLNRAAYAQLAPLYAALHSQRYVSAALALDALEHIAGEAPPEAAAMAVRIARDFIGSARPERAEPFLKAALSWHSEGASLGLLGRLYMTRGQLDRAAALLEQALQTAAEPDFLVWLAICRDGLGDREAAVAALEACLRVDPLRAEAQRMLARWREHADG